MVRLGKTLKENAEENRTVRNAVVNVRTRYISIVPARTNGSGRPWVSWPAGPQISRLGSAAGAVAVAVKLGVPAGITGVDRRGAGSFDGSTVGIHRRALSVSSGLSHLI